MLLRVMRGDRFPDIEMLTPQYKGKRGKGEKIDHFLRLAVLVQPNVLTCVAAIQSAFTVPNFVYIQVLYLLNTTGHLKLTKK